MSLSAVRELALSRALDADIESDAPVALADNGALAPLSDADRCRRNERQRPPGAGGRR